MDLGIVQDYSIKDIYLDTQLTNPKSGVFLNRGVNSLITLKSLVQCLPLDSFTFDDWDSALEYGVYDDDFKNVVNYNGSVWQSLSVNTDSEPSESNDDWLKTSLDSLRIKSFLNRVKEYVNNSIQSDRRIVDSQYLYDRGDRSFHELTGDYSRLVIDSRGSDYTRIKINEVAFEKEDSTDANLYFVNNGVLLDTIELTTNGNGVTFQDVDFTFEGKGELSLVIDSVPIMRGKGIYNRLKYNGFTVKSGIGIGDSPEDCEWTDLSRGIGLGINLTIEASTDKFIENNIYQFSKYFRAVFEYMCFDMFLSSSRSSESLIRMDINYLERQLNALDGNTVVRNMKSEKKKAEKILSYSFDRFLKSGKSYSQGAL